VISPCPLCRYDLTGVDPDATCPECGATANEMAETRRRRHGVARVLRIATWTYFFGMAPAWICYAALVIGWYVAIRTRAFLEIPFVQDGDYPLLDLFGNIALVSGCFATLAIPCALAMPVVLWCRWRTEKPGRVMLWAALLLLAAAPYIAAFLGLHRSFTPAGLGLGAWIPD
jgi:hypothetical protein